MKIPKKRKSCTIVGLTPSYLPYFIPSDDVAEDMVISPDSDYEDTSYKECKMEEHHDCFVTKKRLHLFIEKLVQDGVTEFYCPTEQGIAMWAMEIILDLCNEQNPLNLTLVSAWEGETDHWNGNARYRLFDNILPNPSVKMFRISNSYTDSCVEERNRILVERADVVLAFDDGYTLSDVGSIIRKAKKRNREVLKVTVA